MEPEQQYEFINSNMNYQPIMTGVFGIYRCPLCGLQNPHPISKPFVHRCSAISKQKSLPQDIISKGKRYLNERDIWIKAGKPLRDDAEIERIFTEHCLPCEHFKKKSEKLGVCGLCGCRLKIQGVILNKIAWSTTYCPANPPKWTSDISKVAEEKQEEIQQIIQQVIQQEIKKEQELWQDQDSKQINGLKMREAVQNVSPIRPKRKGGCGCKKS